MNSMLIYEKLRDYKIFFHFNSTIEIQSNTIRHHARPTNTSMKQLFSNTTIKKHTHKSHKITLTWYKYTASAIVWRRSSRCANELTNRSISSNGSACGARISCRCRTIIAADINTSKITKK